MIDASGQGRTIKVLIADGCCRGEGVAGELDDFMRRHRGDEYGLKGRSLRHFLEELLYRCRNCARDVFTRMVRVSYMCFPDPRLACAYL